MLEFVWSSPCNVIFLYSDRCSSWTWKQTAPQPINFVCLTIDCRVFIAWFVWLVNKEYYRQPSLCTKLHKMRCLSAGIRRPTVFWVCQNTNRISERDSQSQWAMNKNMVAHSGHILSSAFTSTMTWFHYLWPNVSHKKTANAWQL